MAAAEPYKSSPTAALARAIATLDQVILGKTKQIKLSLACMMAQGHLLLEDIPGVGKTTLAKAISNCLGLSFRRVQFTSDLLPTDITGVSIYERQTGEFKFREGPVFAQLVLADEINRGTPKSQSALLEAMEESQVTIDGESHPLPRPFFVIATQNPMYQIGTFPLPESQLDRFLMRVSIGYPPADKERQMLSGADRRDVVNNISPQMTISDLLELQKMVANVHLGEPIIDYVQALIRFTREHDTFTFGLSPRAGIRMIRVAQAWALMHGHRGVLPEDVQAIIPGVVSHRLVFNDTSKAEKNLDPGRYLLEAVPIP